MKKVKTKTTGKVILKGKNFSLEEASADDPIYTHGFGIGGAVLKPAPKRVQSKVSDSKKDSKENDK